MKKYILSLFALLLCITGCKEGPDFGDALYMTGTLTSSTVRFLVDGESSIGLTVTSTAKTDTDVKISLTPAPELLAEFNKSTGRNSQLPPEGSYTIDGSEVLISTGKYQSTQIKMSADADKLQEGVSYCLPVSISSVEGGGDLGVLENSRTAYVMLTKVINIKAANLARNNCFDIPGFGGENSPVKALGQMTLEMKVLPVSFPTTPNGAGGISSLVGCEENFLFRFGDGAGKPTNKLQLSKGSIGSATHPDKKDHYESWVDKEFSTGHWLHFAAVYDGQYLRVYLDGEQIHFVETKNGGTINLSMAYDGHTWEDTFAIGRSVGYQRFFNGYISECRVWNVARSRAELEDGICYVDPTSKGLVAYWRFNGETQDDGTVLDMTGHGYNAKPYRTIQWVDNQKCPF
ncbi:DUF1735 and LamG domain-containing protein [Dysgonomonas sp. BGC7]|uniref:DUF1735 and LamG domain-containing protein n=1 Tax=Dysgonomonas sp. BGC7 TaxID=1658008 RepID=UPI0006830484|nr:DUF1735 and LamG domain-containing protein [Dysgonomonas sp. BGC7]MBD8388451.1 DUF1735 domain-containing protein [Dysgonomonas sp. BGC7]